VKDEHVYLQHILDLIARIRRATAQGVDGFHGSEVVQDAVIRNLEIIGEAVGRIAPETLALEPETPWRQIAAFRNRLAHAYLGIDLVAVWRVVERDLLPLESAVKRIQERKGRRR